MAIKKATTPVQRRDRLTRYGRPLKVDKDWFLDRLADRGLSIRKASAILGIDASLLSRRLNGIIAMTPQDIDELTVLLGASYDETARRAGGRSSEGDEYAPVESVAGPTGLITKKRAKRVPLPGADLVGLKGVLVNAPGALCDGWVMFHHPASRIEPDAVGRLSVAGLERGSRLGVLKQGSRRGTWDVQGPDGSVIEAADVRWAAPVLWGRG